MECNATCANLPQTGMSAFRAGLLNRGLAAPVLAAVLVIVALGTLNYVFTSGLWTARPRGVQSARRR